MTDKKRIFSGIKRFYLRRSIKSSLRTKKVHNLSTARSVGLLFRFDELSDYEEIQAIVKKLQERHLDVKVLGFVNIKRVTSHFLPVLSFDFFYSNKLSPLGYKSSQKVKDFVEKPFDICIDLTDQHCFPLMYIMSRSNAHFKIGKFSQEFKDIYDFMIELNEEYNPTDTFQQVEYYLNILKPA